jgi:hypothetical protein
MLKEEWGLGWKHVVLNVGGMMVWDRSCDALLTPKRAEECVGVARLYTRHSDTSFAPLSRLPSVATANTSCLDVPGHEPAMLFGATSSQLARPLTHWPGDGFVGGRGLYSTRSSRAAGR